MTMHWLMWAASGGVGPGLLDIGEWRGPCIDIERSAGDRQRECGQFREDFSRADRALAAADDLETSGAKRG